MAFHEDTRVKIPTILHLIRLGYTYLSLKNNPKRDRETNIFIDIFKQSVADINEGIEERDIDNLIQDVKLSLDNEDLGKAFYQMLVAKSGIKLIDFKDFSRNQFHVLTELTYKNGDEEFRPDITLLINGMPLVFIEVKKPNNRDGVLAERKRIDRRFQNSKFRRFINITQLMVFSNNMEYDDLDVEPIQGAFYAASSYEKPILNYFREEEKLDLSSLLAPEDNIVENFVLEDTNLQSIKHRAEFITNKNPDKPTNRICTSLFNKNRLAFLLQYAIANNDIFSVKTDGGAKVTLFDRVSEFITDTSKRDDFCRALVNKLIGFSFEHIFTQKYDFYAVIFEYLIKDYNKDGGGKYAEYYTPHAVAKIMAAILVPKEQQGKIKSVTCYDPSAGSGTLLMNIAHAIGEERCTIFSQDISQKSSSLLRLNLILNNLVHSIQILFREILYYIPIIKRVKL